MGRILPNIWENNPSVPNHQPLRVSTIQGAGRSAGFLPSPVVWQNKSLNKWGDPLPQALVLGANFMCDQARHFDCHKGLP